MGPTVVVEADPAGNDFRGLLLVSKMMPTRTLLS